MRPTEVRPARPEDLDDLVALCLTARGESSVGPQVCSSDATELAHQLGALATVPGGTILVALHETRTVGLLIGRLMGPNLFTDEVSLAVESIYVDPDHRRRGVGHALMSGAVDLAAESGAQHVYAAPIPGARGMQRFFVQLGFGPAAAHRVTSTSALQRKLAQDAAGPVRRSGPRGLEDLIARRRQSRAATGELPVVAPVAASPGPAVAGSPQVQPGRLSISMHVRRAVQTRREPESSTTIS